MSGRSGVVRSAAARVALAGLVAVGVGACDDESTMLEPDQNLVELASSSPELETLVAAIGAAGLESALEGSGAPAWPRGVGRGAGRGPE